MKTSLHQRRHLPRLRFTFWVGTGDSAIIDMGEQEILIDGGNYANDLHDYVKREDLVQGPIELVIVTHGDQDHWKGMVRLFNFDGKGTAPRTLREFWDLQPGLRSCGSGREELSSVH